MPEHVLFITCSSGHGHMVATNNIQSEIIANSPDAVFHTLDIVDYLHPFEPIVVDLWNTGIRQDSLLAHLLPRAIGFYEFFYERFLETKLSNDLQALFDGHPIARIIDTQPMFTPLLVKQAAKVSKNPVAYHKVLTDLPVNSNHPFFSGIKKRKHFENLDFFMHGAPPLTQAPNTPEEFWRKHCNVGPEHYSSAWGTPVHSSFRTVPKNRDTVSVKINPELAAHIGLPATGQITIPADAHVTTLMMGSQGLEVIYDYFKKIQKTFAGKMLPVPHYFFIACSRNQDLFNNLLKECLKDVKNNPYLKIIPLDMQPAENVASLMWRSQMIILRASGLSCIEQIAMDEAARKAGVPFNPIRLIHSHCKKHIPAHLTQEQKSAFLLAHSVGHEKANSIYLQQKLGAVLTCVDLIQF
ncbi:MAG: hypothetical protein ACHQAX_01300 [Gammaproteobacteria bacterium]